VPFSPLNWVKCWISIITRLFPYSSITDMGVRFVCIGYLLRLGLSGACVSTLPLIVLICALVRLPGSLSPLAARVATLLEVFSFLAIDVTIFNLRKRWRNCHIRVFLGHVRPVKIGWRKAWWSLWPRSDLCLDITSAGVHDSVSV